MTSPSANKGEWSELYAIGYLLTNGGGHAADEHAGLDKSIFYKVLEIEDNPTGSLNTIYKILGTEIEIRQNGVALITISQEQIKPKLLDFFNDLLGQDQAHAFTLDSGLELMNMIHKNKLSASSSLTSDIHLVLEDEVTKTPIPKKGFSVKSEIGSPATVFNASHSTNITYQITGKGKPKSFGNVSKVKTNIKRLR